MCQVTACPTAFVAARKAGRSVARQFPKLWGWSAADFVAEARLLYVEAVRRWDGRGSLPRFVYQFVRRRLLNRVRSQCRHNPRLDRHTQLFDVPVENARDFDAELRGLSEPARQAAGLLFGCLRQDGSPGTRPCVIKAKVRKRLKRSWGAAKANLAFWELKGLVS
jgi:hypothetical protein